MELITNKFEIVFKKLNIELTFWLAGLIYLGISPLNDESYFTLCPLKNLGFDYCPGCGLGSSITHILHLKILESFSIHPLGLFALLIIFLRIAELLSIKKYYHLIKTYLQKYWSYYGKYFSVITKS